MAQRHLGPERSNGHEDPTTNLTQFDIYGWAERLVATVSKHRLKGKPKKRALLFVCQGTGGIVVKEALGAGLRTNKSSQSCVHVTFVNVPHDGAEILSNSDYANDVQMSLDLPWEMSARLRENFIPGNARLRLVHSEFLKTAVCAKIYNFFEGSETQLQGRLDSEACVEGKALVVPEQSSLFQSFGMPPNDAVNQRLEGAYGGGSLSITNERVKNDWIESISGALDLFRDAYFKHGRRLKHEIIEKVKIDVHFIVLETSTWGRRRSRIFSTFPSLGSYLTKGTERCLAECREAKGLPELEHFDSPSLSWIYVPYNHIGWLAGGLDRIQHDHEGHNIEPELLSEWYAAIGKTSRKQWEKKSYVGLSEHSNDTRKPQDRQLVVSIPYLNWDSLDTVIDRADFVRKLKQTPR